MGNDLLCYDESTGTWFKSSEEQIRELRLSMNEKLVEKHSNITIQDFIEVLNSNLPEDKKIKLDGHGWADVPLRKGDRLTYDGVRCNLNGEITILLQFTPNTSTENWVRAE